MLDGRCDAALTLARARRHQAPPPNGPADPYLGSWMFLEALLAAHGGYPAAAREAVEHAVAALSADDPKGSLGPATALQAALLARDGTREPRQPEVPASRALCAFSAAYAACRTPTTRISSPAGRRVRDVGTSVSAPRT